eukprot:TRINITY_DN8555_c0_g1_i1.p1 TRINITY_DN8555_c0_g1~~TRINITY_DN8555_c0_g1_i1.p1  ORF type:complete len:142 (-),score=23.50 TRINITY_DN8555_c0_g1_i1:50-475(-)
MGKQIRIAATTRVMHSIDRVGGLDTYLLTTSDKHLVSKRGIELKRELEAILRRETGGKSPNLIMWENRQRLLEEDRAQGGIGRITSPRPPPLNRMKKAKGKAAAEEEIELGPECSIKNWDETNRSVLASWGWPVPPKPEEE